MPNSSRRALTSGVLSSRRTCPFSSSCISPPMPRIISVTATPSGNVSFTSPFGIRSISMPSSSRSLATSGARLDRWIVFSSGIEIIESPTSSSAPAVASDWRASELSLFSSSSACKSSKSLDVPNTASERVSRPSVVPSISFWIALMSLMKPVPSGPTARLISPIFSLSPLIAAQTSSAVNPTAAKSSLNLFQLSEDASAFCPDSSIAACTSCCADLLPKAASATSE